MVRVRIASLAVLVALLAPTDDASACTIMTPSVVLPRGSAAPPNAHVWVQGVGLAMWNGGSFVVFASDDPKRPLELDVRSWETSMVWELTPRERLREKTRYEVWGVPRDKKKGTAELLGTFRTGTADATTPPAPPTARAAEQLHPIGSCPDFITAIGTPAPSAGEDVLLAAWLSDAQGHIVYDVPPDEIFAWHAGNPEIDRFFVHKAPRRLGLRAVDVAGNVSAATELDVTTR